MSTYVRHLQILTKHSKLKTQTYKSFLFKKVNHLKCRIRAAHDIVVQTGYAGFHQFQALLLGPFNSDIFCVFLIRRDLIRERIGNIKVKITWQPDQVAGGGKNLHAGNNWYVNTCISALIHKCKKSAVVKKHLRDDVVSAGVYLFFKLLDIPIKVWSLKMLLRVSGHTYTKVR